jgi:hypothetical protein
LRPGATQLRASSAQKLDFLTSFSRQYPTLLYFKDEILDVRLFEIYIYLKLDFVKMNLVKYKNHMKTTLEFESNNIQHGLMLQQYYCNFCNYH